MLIDKYSDFGFSTISQYNQFTKTGPIETTLLIMHGIEFIKLLFDIFFNFSVLFDLLD